MAFFGQKSGDGWEPSQEEAIELVLRLFTRQLRLNIRNGPYGGAIGSESRRAADRFARSKSRSELKKYRRRASIERPRGLQKDILLTKFARSPILDILIPNRESRWRPILRRIKKHRLESVTVRNFSFLTHPNETLKLLKKIGELELKESSVYLHFEDEFCLDAGSYLVLAEVWNAVRHAFVGGKMERPVQKVLAATGVGEHNKMKLLSLGRGRDDDHADIWAFTLHRRRPAKKTKSPTVHLDPQTREKVADLFCKKIDEWLGLPEIEQELTDEGRAWIVSIIGELLCNAERHSQIDSDDGDWSTTAFMVRMEEGGESTLRCYIAFLSVGRSIAESLDDASEDVREALQDYVSRHDRCGASRETLATVFALQDAVTRDPAARSERSGGTGLQDVLDFVNLLGGTTAKGREPKVTVVSGSSCIQMRPPYIQGQRKDGERSPRVIWFNDANAADRPPDGKFVMDLDEHFAGTLVSVAFTLDPAYLSAHTDSSDDDDQPG